MSKSSNSPVKILLADDSVTMHRAVSLALKKENYDLICVDNGKDALRLIYEHRPSVVLLDLDMPERTGIEVAREIRDDANLAKTQIVLLCGSFDEVNEKDVEKAPVDARLWKPFESHVLLAMLKTLLSARSTPASKTDTHEAADPTAPIAESKPPIPTPKSRKDQAIEDALSQVENQIQEDKLSHKQAYSLQRAIDETRPISVDDLFEPNKKRPTPDVHIPEEATVFPHRDEVLESNDSDNDDGDFSRSLTQETFGSTSMPEELPPPTEKQKEKLELSEDPQVKEDPFVQNLWDPEEFSSFEEKTQFSDEDLNEFPSEESSEAAEESLVEFEILSPSNEESSITSAHSSAEAWMPPPIDDLIEETAQVATSHVQEELAKTPATQAPYSTLELRVLVEKEVKRVFHEWLHDELKRQLNEVMDELENELQ
jgi:DNA-binding response OmpR family regulator